MIGCKLLENTVLQIWKHTSPFISALYFCVLSTLNISAFPLILLFKDVCCQHIKQIGEAEKLWQQKYENDSTWSLTKY